jgi:hypothetical protein
MLDRNPRRRPAAAALLGGPAGTRVHTVHQPLVRRRLSAPATVGVAAAAAAVVAGAAAFAVLGPFGPGRSPEPAAGGPEGALSAAGPPCTPLPYQPCGTEPAPNTDGRACIPEHADYDLDRLNGCEAVPDGVDGTGLGRDSEIEANLVPAEDVDTYPVDVGDRFQLLCDGAVRLTLTAPPGVAQELTVLHEAGEVVETAGSTDGHPATIELSERSCFGDDSATFEARVSTISGHSAEPYRLERVGGF